MEAATTPKTKSLFVSVLGTPNVGKSSLINAMVLFLLNLKLHEIKSEVF